MHGRPSKSSELLVLQSLLPRMQLSKEDKHRLENLEKGYEGEMKFYQHVQETLPSSQTILYDLLLPSNQTEFQLDSLLLKKDKILLFEIKNFEGDFYIQEDNWYVASTKKEIKNPFLQLQRSEFYLRNLLRHWGYPSLFIEPYLIFVHSEFTLYQAPLSKNIIFPTQLKRFLHKLQAADSANISQPVLKLKEKFIKQHRSESIYQQIPTYDYHQLKKGLFCPDCNTCLRVLTPHRLFCVECQLEMKSEKVVLHSIKEFKLLFPLRKVKTKTIYNWCGNQLSMSTIRKILAENFVYIDKGSASYYTSKLE